MNIPVTFFDWINYIIQNSGMSMLRGARNTLIISFVATVFGCLIGFIIGIIQTIPVDKGAHPLKKTILRITRLMIGVYVEVFRGTPMMAQAFFIYYGSAILFNINMSMWFAAFFIVSINTGAYMSETVRGGILSIDPGQTEGAKAIGMTHFQTMTSVILPQALRNIMPQISNNLIINIKDTCVLAMIGIVELMYASRGAAGANYRYFETFTLTMIMYLAMTLFFSRVLRIVEKKMDGERNYDLATHDTLAHTSGMFSYPSKEGKQ
ncbi:MAG: amino acid ABC transporter permease [Clostridiales bacterium]|nr:amino acid ABC transporter permease [Clostridiales bacterium]